VSLELNSTDEDSLLFVVNSSLKLTPSLSKKLVCSEPMTLANLWISAGLYSTQSENNNDIYSFSIER
jgi:hypothetical protein